MTIHDLRYLSLLLLFAVGQVAVGQIRPSLKGKSIQHAASSFYAVDAETGEVIASSPQVSLAPASVMKVVTTATAITLLGEEHRFTTRLFRSGHLNQDSTSLVGNLVLKGGGDPAFYSSYFEDHYRNTFEEWLKQLQATGIKSVQGDLIVDLSYLAGQRVPEGWVWGDLGNYYGAAPSALSYRDNQYEIHFSSPSGPNLPTSVVSIVPPVDGLKLINRVRSSTQNRDLASIYGAPGSFDQQAEGTIPMNRSDFVVKAAMPDPAQCAALDFVKILEKGGITLKGKLIFSNICSSDSLILVAEKQSPPLKELIIPLNKESLNLFAEHLLIEVGKKMNETSQPVQSTDQLVDFWKEKGVFVEGFYPTDGSGLSRSNGITPRTLVEILRSIYKGPMREPFFASLPVSGVDGTLQSAFIGTPLDRKVIAKTGSMTRVRCLAGMLTNTKGRKVIFAVMINNFEGSQSMVFKSIENLLLEL